MITWAMVFLMKVRTDAAVSGGLFLMGMIADVLIIHAVCSVLNP